MVARWAHNPKVDGSNPSSATKLIQTEGEIMTINHISRDTRLKVLMRLLKDNEQFNIACSKSGLSLHTAKKLLDDNNMIKQ